MALSAGMSPATVFAASILLTGVLAVALAYGLWLVERMVLQVPFVRDIWNRYVLRARERARPYVERFGAVGIILFVAIPLPGTGVWTGSIVGYLMGIDPKHLGAYTFIGGIIANTITFLASVGLLSVIG